MNVREEKIEIKKAMQIIRKFFFIKCRSDTKKPKTIQHELETF